MQDESGTNRTSGTNRMDPEERYESRTTRSRKNKERTEYCTVDQKLSRYSRFGTSRIDQYGNGQDRSGNNSEAISLNFYGAQKSIPRNQFRQPM